MDPLAREVLQEFGGEGEDDGGVLRQISYLLTIMDAGILVFVLFFRCRCSSEETKTSRLKLHQALGLAGAVPD